MINVYICVIYIYDIYDIYIHIYVKSIHICIHLYTYVNSLIKQLNVQCLIVYIYIHIYSLTL